MQNIQSSSGTIDSITPRTLLHQPSIEESRCYPTNAFRITTANSVSILSTEIKQSKLILITTVVKSNIFSQPGNYGQQNSRIIFHENNKINVDSVRLSDNYSIVLALYTESGVYLSSSVVLGLNYVPKVSVDFRGANIALAFDFGDRIEGEGEESILIQDRSHRDEFIQLTRARKTKMIALVLYDKSWNVHFHAFLQSSDITLTSIMITPIQSIVVAGDFHNKMRINSSVCNFYEDLTGGPGQSIYITSFDPRGNLLWALPITCTLGENIGSGIKSYDLTCSQEYLWLIGERCQNISDCQILFGDSSDNSNIQSLSQTPGTNESNLFIVSYDMGGHVNNYFTISTGRNIFDTEATEQLKLVVDNEGSIFVAHYQNSMLLVSKYSSLGEIQWQRFSEGLDMVQNDGKISMVLDQDQNIIIQGNWYLDYLRVYNSDGGGEIAGRFQLQQFYRLPPSASYNVFMLAYDSNGSIKWINKQKLPKIKGGNTDGILSQSITTGHSNLILSSNIYSRGPVELYSSNGSRVRNIWNVTYQFIGIITYQNLSQNLTVNSSFQPMTKSIELINGNGSSSLVRSDPINNRLIVDSNYQPIFGTILKTPGSHLILEWKNRKWVICPESRQIILIY